MSQLTDLRNRYDEQLRELSGVRDELRKSTLLCESKDGAIASLTKELEKWKDAGASKDKRIADTLKQVEKLESELSTSVSKLTDLQTRYDKQSRELTAVRDELQTSILSIKSKDKDMTSLTARVAQLEAEIAEKAKQVSENQISQNQVVTVLE